MYLSDPYIQYFSRLSRYHDAPPFGASLLVYFRAGIGVNLIDQVNNSKNYTTRCRSRSKSRSQKNLTPAANKPERLT